MSDINEVVVTGRITRDAELRQTPNGTSVTDIGIASNRVWSKESAKQEETTFVDVTIWGKQAESLKPYLVKGRHVMVVGRLKLNKWETDEGVKRSKLSVVAEKVNLTPNGSSSSESQKACGSGSWRRRGCAVLDCWDLPCHPVQSGFKSPSQSFSRWLGI